MAKDCHDTEMLNSLDKMDKYFVVYRFLNSESLSSLNINTSSNDAIENFKCVKLFSKHVATVELGGSKKSGTENRTGLEKFQIFQTETGTGGTEKSFDDN